MLLLASLTAALAAGVAAQHISAAKTVSNINGITSMSHALDKTAQSVTLVNGFQTGPEVINGFHSIVKQATKDYNEMNGNNQNSKRSEPPMHPHWFVPRQSTTYTIKEQDAVCNAFIGFVKVHQALLATVIGKHGILEVTGVAYQMAAVLRGVEGVVDEIAFTLIGEIPHCAAKAKEEKNALDKSLLKSIDTYANGLP